MIKTFEDLFSLTKEECRQWFLKMDIIQTRKETAKQLGTTTYKLRKVAEYVGVVYNQGRRSKMYRFKGE